MNLGSYRPRRFGIFSKVLILFFLLLLIIGCSGTLAGGGASDTSIQSLDEGESELFEDGPISLPVTIAKLESPDSRYITMAQTDNGAFEFVGAGAATAADGRAISDPATTDYVLAYNVTTEESQFFAVDETGAFGGEIDGAVQDRIILFAVTSDNLDELQASPGVIFVMDSLGTVTVTITNASAINDALPMMPTPSGDVIFSVVDDNGAYDVWRRNIDGSLPEIIFEDLKNLPLRLASVGDSANNDEQQFFLLDSGMDILFAYYDSETSSFAKLAFAEDLMPIDPTDPDLGTARGFYLSSIDSSHVVVKYNLGPTEDVVEIFDNQGNRVVLLPSEAEGGPNPQSGLNLETAWGGQLILWYVDESTSRTSAFLLDVSDPELYDTAWASRTTIALDSESEILGVTVDQSDANLIYLIEKLGDAHRISQLILSESDPQLRLIADVLGYNFQGRLRHFETENGNFLMTCDSFAAPQILIIPLDDWEDSSETTADLIPLTSNSEIDSCQQYTVTATSDGEYYLHVFTYPDAEGSAQLSHIDMQKNAILGPYF